MPSPSPRPNLAPTDPGTGERYRTFDAHLGIDTHLHARAHMEPCKTTLAALSAFGTFDGECIERHWDLVALKKGKAKL
ncbi:hypothetical protein FB45DRAFT_1042459 [Roridomyces roridus]|uniref:Uncharacterized protein n=1 Tax=Roridomyces roridus TaxID=1738132 RepID=A0AAD7F6P4_9AGAR|nr:hypothetical protein FB45DRAFT_1042459 [Roridomyces roridus]